ncbi:MAG: hypothetical protein NC311_11855 [Muribaculaceae bacterium]|nr:hypothetical protein [Muribaculaceae bacterium]
MRKLVNIKVQQFTEDIYAMNELSAIGDFPSEYDFPLLHHYDYQTNENKEFENHIYALLKREYAKNLALMIANSHFVYCNNMHDVFSFAKHFITEFADVYHLCPQPDIANAGDSIKELITCYEEKIKECTVQTKEFETLKNFLLKIPSKPKGTIRINQNYLDQYASYYADALRCFLSVLTTVFHTYLEQPKPQILTGFQEEIINTNQQRFNAWFDKFETEYEFETPATQIEFSQKNPHIHIEIENFNSLKVHFKDVNFYAENVFNTVNNLFLSCPFVRTLEFENCIFNFCFYENSRSLFFRNCTFNNTFDYNAKPYASYQQIISVLMFEKCTFNVDVTIDDITENMHNTLILKDCRFSDTANFRLSNIMFLKAHFENIIFNGGVFFENVRFTAANWSNLFFLTDFRNKDILLPDIAKFKQILFSMKMVKIAPQSIKNFIKLLKTHKLESYAQELEQFYLNDLTASKNKFDIAARSKWLNIKQAADYLGLSYNTLLTKRKEDKANGGQKTIYYRGEGKNSRYYIPFLDAYKSGDMKRANEIAKEIEKKE